jgi:hypothetical protein
MDTGDDVIDMKRPLVSPIGQAAVFTTLSSSRPDKIPQSEIHGA